MRILVVRTSALGDTVLATPALRALHERHTGAEIHFVTQPPWAPIVDGLPFVTKVWRWTMPGGRRTIAGIPSFAAGLRQSGAFDLAIDLQNSPATRLLLAAVRPGRTIRFVKRRTLGAVLGSLVGEGPVLDGLPAAALYLEALGPLGFPTHAQAAPGDLVALGSSGALLADVASEARAAPARLPPLRDPVTGWDLRPAIHVSADASARAEALLAPAGGGTIVALAPGGRWATKRWPAARFAEVGDALAKEGARVVLVGGPGDVAELAEVAAAMRQPPLGDTASLSVAELAAVIQRADVLVACDSAPNHLAQAVGTPVVTVFGPTSARRWGPLPGAGAAVSLPIGCSPCSNFGKRPCPLGHHACMRDLGAGPVIAAALAALREGRMRGGSAAFDEFVRARVGLAAQVARTPREVKRR